MVCTSCKTSYNVLNHSHVTNWGLDRIVGWGGSGSGGLVVLFGGGGMMQKRESPNFRFPQVGITRIFS